MKLLFLDTETTGVDPLKNGVVQIAGIVDIDGEVVEEFELKCRPFPGQTYTMEALKVIEKTIDELKAYPDPRETFNTLLKIFQKYIDRYNKNDKFNLVGQCPRFDYDMLDAWFKNNGERYFYAYIQYHLIDLVAATALFRAAGKIQVPNMKLETMSKYFGIPHKAHDALEDIRVTRKIFYQYVDLVKQIQMPAAATLKEESVS